MPKFRKKPVVIEAERCTECREIETLEGTMVAQPGDWIITGVQGERYPCKPDIFEATYDPAPEEGEVVVEFYNHHGAPTAVQTHLKGRHREHCLCYSCDRLCLSNWEENCFKANILYRICVALKLTIPVWECEDWQPREDIGT